MRFDNLGKRVDTIEKDIILLKEAIEEHSRRIETLYNRLAFLIEFRTEMMMFKSEMNEFKNEVSSKVDTLVNIAKITQQWVGQHEVDIRIIKKKVGISEI